MKRQRRLLSVAAAGALAFSAWLGMATSTRAQAPNPADPDLVFWLRADQGVATTPDAGGPIVTAVNDSSDNGVNMTGAGTPRLVARTFASGPRSVISFGGAGGPAALFNGSDAIDLMNASIYMVATNDTGAPSQAYIGNFAGPVAGYVTGISDGTPSRIKFFNATSPVGPTDSLEPAGATLTPDVPFLLTATFTGLGSNKNLYFDGTFAGSSSNVHDYAGNLTEFTIGGLDGDGEGGTGGNGLFQLLSGDIAEILIFSSVSQSQRLSVEAYLNNKYFTAIPEPASVGLLSLGASVLLLRRRRRA